MVDVCVLISTLYEFRLISLATHDDLFTGLHLLPAGQEVSAELKLEVFRTCMLLV